MTIAPELGGMRYSLGPAAPSRNRASEMEQPVAAPADVRLWLGIAAGLVSCACMSLAYLLSRHHTLAAEAAGRTGAAVRLLLRSHVVMGLAALPGAAWLVPGGLDVAAVAPPLLGAAGLYFAGNTLLFRLLRRYEASRLTPFLGLKIFVLALVVAVVLGQPLAGRQWAAVATSVAATALLQGRGGGLAAGALGRILVVCLCFALSDLFIVSLIDGIEAGGGPGFGRFRASILGMLLTYVVCGAACGLALFAGRQEVGRDRRAGWVVAGLYAATWLVAMGCLYVCFGFVGAVLGNVVQSFRGIMSVVIGAALAHLGWHELEQRVDRATLLRRIAAAGLMTAAIAVYVA